MSVLAVTLGASALPSANVAFTLADNTTVNITATQLTEALGAIMSKSQQAWATAVNLRAQINAAGSIAEVAAVKWP